MFKAKTVGAKHEQFWS